MTPSGTAEDSPAIPTRGEVTEPSKNGMTPSSAAALPALCPCDSIAKAKEEGWVMPFAATKKNSETTSAINGP